MKNVSWTFFFLVFNTLIFAYSCRFEIFLSYLIQDVRKSFQFFSIPIIKTTLFSKYFNEKEMLMQFVIARMHLDKESKSSLTRLFTFIFTKFMLSSISFTLLLYILFNLMFIKENKHYVFERLPSRSAYQGFISTKKKL